MHLLHLPIHIHTLIMDYQKEKLRKQFHFQVHQKNKILRNKFKQGGKRFVR